MGHSAYPSASTWIAPPPPVPRNAIAGPAATIRAGIPGLALIGTTRVVELSDAERIVAEGSVDVVGMTRALIADPELIAKASTGREREVITCVGCNQACIGHYHAGVPIGCAVNPRTGRELRILSAKPRTRGRRVLVIGAGPAGAAAALEAATAGDAVTLVEREPELGGQLRLAGHAPAHRELWDLYRRSTLHRLQAAGVAVEHRGDADAELAADFDVVVLATGARPYEPPLPHDPRFLVRQAWEAIQDPDQVRGPALIADWGGGWEGLDAAERLALAGVEITLACAAPMPGETLHQYQRNLYLARLDELGVTILHHMSLSSNPGSWRWPTCSLSDRRRCPRLRHWCSPRAGCRWTSFGQSSKATRERSAPATSWGRARWRRRCSRGRWRCAPATPRRHDCLRRRSRTRARVRIGGTNRHRS